MLNKGIIKKSTVIFVLIIFSALAWGDQKKTGAPAPSKPAQPAAKPAAKPVQPAARPVQRTTTPPARVQPANAGAKQPSGSNFGSGNQAGSNKGGGGTPSAGGGGGKGGGGTPGAGGGGGKGGGGTSGAGGGGRSFSDPRSSSAVPTRGGGTLERDRNNKPTHFVGKQGQEAKFGNRGQIREVRDLKRGMTVERGFHPGDRKVVSIDRNGHHLVSMGPHRGYLERPYSRDRYNQPVYQRTYWVHGHPHAYAYRDHFYRGVHYYRYAPAYYYHPVFYGWAYNPWAAPVYYNWGWGPAPWLYGGYFAPAPVYPTASLWLTDYLLAENLKLAYEAKQEGAANPEPPQPGEQPAPPEAGSAAATPMDPHVKEMVDAEVHRELQAEQAAAQSPQAQPAYGDQAPPPALDPKQRLFVVSSNLGVSTAEGQECELAPGDVITRIESTPGTDGKVEVSVMSSKPNDCEVGSSPRVAVTDLQEMHNNFRQQLDAGLDALAKNSGTGGLPKAPDTQTSAGQVPLPAPDKGVDAQLADQQRQADDAEREVQQEVKTAQAPAKQ